MRAGLQATADLFAAFARAGEDGLTAEQIRAACAAFPDEVIDNRLDFLKKLGAIQPAFDKPYQREYRASFTSYVSMLFVQRMLARGVLVAELVALTIGGTVEALRERAPLCGTRSR